MKISTILIKSQHTRKQGLGYLTHADENGKIDSYCAVGAIGCAKGIITKHVGNSMSATTILKEAGVDPIKLHTLFQCSECHADKDGLAQLIVHLNDGHHWTFEQIGNYLKELGL